MKNGYFDRWIRNQPSDTLRPVWFAEKRESVIFVNEVVNLWQLPFSAQLYELQGEQIMQFFFLFSLSLLFHSVGVRVVEARSCRYIK